MSEDTGSRTEADAGRFERQRELVPVICGAHVYLSPCSCVLPYPHADQGDPLSHQCLHGPRCGS